MGFGAGRIEKDIRTIIEYAIQRHGNKEFEWKLLVKEIQKGSAIELRLDIVGDEFKGRDLNRISRIFSTPKYKKLQEEIFETIEKGFYRCKIKHFVIN